MKDLGFIGRIALWTAGSGAFGIAEVLMAPDPLGAEPISLLLSAIGLYALLGGITGFIWHLVRGILKRLVAPALIRSLNDRWLALVPAGILLLPKLPIALSSDGLLTTVTLAAALLVAILISWLLPTKISIEKPAWVYGMGALALWTILLRIKDLARIAQEKTGDIAIDAETAMIFAGSAVLTALTVSLAERFQRRKIALLAVLLFAATASFHLMQLPGYAIDTEPAAERIGRGTPVILIVLDTVRADHMSLYGYPRSTTPELEKLSRQAVVFDRAISASSWTLPAHASLFTGLLPLAHGALRLPGLDDDAATLSERGIHRPTYPLSEDFGTLSEWFSDAGYSTGAVIANYAYLDPAFHVSQGFDDYFAVRNTPVEPRILKVIHRKIRPLPQVVRHWQVYRDADQINELAERWLDAQATHRFLLFLNYMEAHLPWGPHQPGLHYEEFAAEPGLPDRPGGSPAPDAAFRERVDLYDSNIASLDAELGKLFEHLRSLNLFDRSLIVITSDHGESFGENAFDGHGKSLNEAEIRVPLVIKYPESRHVGRDARRVQLVDLPPTITHILGQPFRDHIDGRAIRLDQTGDAFPGSDSPEAADAPDAQPYVLAELYTDPREPDDVFHGYRAAIYDGPLKLVIRSDGQSQLFSEQNGLELPVDTPPELQAWVDEQIAFVMNRFEILEKTAKSRQSEIELDPEVAAGLEALGYI